MRLSGLNFLVSTHSRAEAAAWIDPATAKSILGFNTQPRGGGCFPDELGGVITADVSTHSRAEAAAIIYIRQKGVFPRFQHTAARRRLPLAFGSDDSLCPVSTHSRAEAAASAAKENWRGKKFQHTAARRRLLPT